MTPAPASHASSAAASPPPSSMSETAQRPQPRDRGPGGPTMTLPTMPADVTAQKDRPTEISAPRTAAEQKRALDKQSVEYLWRSGVAGGVAGSVVRNAPSTAGFLVQKKTDPLANRLQAKSIVAPLDRVKILFQASNPQFAKYSGSWAGVARAMTIIYQQDGVLGLYRGHSATLLRVFPYAAVKFIAYEQIRGLLIPRREHETPLRRLLSGSLAGVTSVFFTYPLEVIRVRLAFETRNDGHSSLASICRRIYYEHPHPADAAAAAKQTSSAAAAAAAATTATTSATVPPSTQPARPPRTGISNFYRGFSATILGMLPYAGMSFLTHDTCGDILRMPVFAKWTTLPAPPNAPPGKPVPLRSWAELLAGGVAGLVSQTASYPLEVIRRRMQVGGAVGDGRRLRIGETAQVILRERGVRGFFVGLTIGYVKVVPMAAASFYTYERLKRFFGI